VRSDREIVELCKDFVLLRMTYLRGVNIGLFEYDYDQTWMSFFLDPDGRVISRYGSRDSTSADSHNTSEGLRNAMREALSAAKEDAVKKLPPYAMPQKTLADIPAYNRMYAGSCGRCHMANEAIYEQKRADGTLKPGAFFLYPLPENIGIKLDLAKTNKIKAILPNSIAEKHDLRVGDSIRRANGQRIITTADMQYVLDKLDSPGKLTLDLDRKGKAVQVEMELTGNWRASDVSWRKSIRMRSSQNAFTRNLFPLRLVEKDELGIPRERLGFRLNDSMGDVQKAGFQKGDVVVAFDGKREFPYRNPQYYSFMEHASGDLMDVTVLRNGKEETIKLRVP
jgi:hypothetical protein